MRSKILFLLIVLIICSCNGSINNSIANKPQEGNTNILQSSSSESVEDINSDTSNDSSYCSIESSLTNINSLESDFLETPNHDINLSVVVNEDKTITFTWSEFSNWSNIGRENYSFFIENNNVFEKALEVDTSELSYTFISAYSQLYGNKKTKICACEILSDGTFNVLGSSNILEFPA